MSRDGHEIQAVNLAGVTLRSRRLWRAVWWRGAIPLMAMIGLGVCDLVDRRAHPHTPHTRRPTDPDRPPRSRSLSPAALAGVR